MQITFIARKLNTTGGGSNFSLDLLAQSLAERGNDVTIVTIKSNMNHLPPNPAYDVVTPDSSTPHTRIGELKAVYHWMKDHWEGTDIFHIFTPTYLAPAGFLCSRTGFPPTVGRLNNYGLFCTNTTKMDGECHRDCGVSEKFAHDTVPTGRKVAKIPLYAFQTHFESRYAKELDRYFAISPSIMEIYSEIGIDKKKIKVVPNFYDPDFPLGEASNSLWDSESLRVLYVGRLTGTKGVGTLIQAVKGLESVDLRIVGGGPEESRLKSLVSNRCSNVSFEGWIEYDQLPPYYKSADVFVHPATWPEPFGRSVLESLQCGTPAIVSQIGAPPWIVGDAGLTFEPGNRDQLTSILSDFREDESRQRELATNCSHRVEQFSPDTIIPQVLSEYRNLLKNSCSC